MEHLNSTPYPSMVYEALDTQGEEFHVAVLRITYAIESTGQCLIAESQDPLILTDEFQRDAFKSSVKQESDLAPYKPWCDVIVIGNALAPGQKPLKRFEAGVRMSRKGDTILSKRLFITGPRYWENRLLRGWTLTEPQPIQSLPIRYEFAHGGECRIETTDRKARQIKTKFKLTPEQRAQHPEGPDYAPIAHSCAEMNPIGQGYTASWYLQAKKPKRIPAAQIESPLDPIKTMRKMYAPQGLGVIGRPWALRLQLAGTLDDAFIKSDRWLPSDFDFAYWNGAHPDMQVPWLQGDEIIDLINISVPDVKTSRTDSQGNRIIRLKIPHIKIQARATHEGGTLERMFNIDTLVIDAPLKKMSLVYRLKLPKTPILQNMEIVHG